MNRVDCLKYDMIFDVFFNRTWHQKIWKWKTTSKKLKMEDDLKHLENGRWPQKIWKWKMTFFWKKKTTLIIKEPTKIKSKTNHSGTALGNPVFNTFLLLPLTKHSTEEVVKIQTQPTAQFNRIEVALHSYSDIHLPPPPQELSLLYCN